MSTAASFPAPKRTSPDGNGIELRRLCHSQKYRWESSMPLAPDNEPIPLEHLKAMIYTFREANPTMWSVPLGSADLMFSDLTHPVRWRKKKRPSLSESEL
jgi:hypothetical protein